MNYKKVYDRIVENRLNNPLSKDEYGERHHIIPRSLGGSNRTDNLVRLSAREHFICHALLAEIYEYGSVEWIKMNQAFMMMKGASDNQKRYFNSRLYELKKEDFSKTMSYTQSGGGNSQYGKPRSEEVRDKIRKTLKRNTPTKRELRDLGRKMYRNTQSVYYNNLYRTYKTSEIVSLNEFVKLTDYPFSLVNLVRSFMKYVDGYEKTQGKAK